MRTGTCKFGASCKYHHPRQRGGDSVTVSLNYMGFPLRPVCLFNLSLVLSLFLLVVYWSLNGFSLQGEKECSYYMRTGHCKFGSTCRFHHPLPPGVQPPSQQLSAIYPSLHSQSGVFVARPQLLPGSYVQSPYGTYSQMVLPPTGMVPYPGWNPYQVTFQNDPTFFLTS